MCGRFRLTGGSRLLLRFRQEYGVEVAGPDGGEPALPESSVTFLPFHDVPVFCTDSEGRTRVRPMYWQLIHYWEREFKSPYTQFNTRVESLHKRHNRDLLERRRCVFPASGFYETRKEPYEFTLKDRTIIPLGGIYSIWTNPEDGSGRRCSCSIITTEPNSLVAEVHDRMPFIIPAARVGDWLNRDITVYEQLLDMIRPYDAQKMNRVRAAESSPPPSQPF
ncbi:hypothetical protein BMS3Abin01_01250 [bacterium BMS3Abin01]|nr:hypothetical protein BMS3Abin01_01250 [bacterium BMS3Abin01]HDZ59234.1 SOS response-associated peptidase [Actinomycetota bacterium]